MSFDRYLESLDEDAGGKEHIALALFYLEEIEGHQSVSQADIRPLIEESISTFSPSGTSRYITRLSEDGWIAPVGDNQYRMTPGGIEEVTGLLGEDVHRTARAEDDLFLYMTDFQDDDRYTQLVSDINESYRYRIYDATMVLTRKLFEDIVYQILQTHYAGEDVQMFYDQENSRHYSFEDLLNNLREAVPTLRRYSRELDDRLVEDLRELKNEGNSGAHAIRVDFTDEEMEAWSSDATRIAEILYDVLEGARIADDE